MGGAVIGTIVKFAIIGTAAGAAATVLRRAMADDPGYSDWSQDIRANTRDPSTKIPIIYGKMLVGGNDVFIHVKGDDNQKLYVVQTLSEGPCDSIVNLYLGDKPESDFGNKSDYWFRQGTATQTYPSEFHDQVPRWIDNLRYTCHIIWKLTYDYDLFQSLPQRTVKLKGRQLFDFRDATTAWSDNPVLALYDFMTNTRYGFGFSQSEFDLFDLESWSEAADYCDTKGWTINMRIDRDESGGDVIDKICRLFRGQLVWYNGKFYLRYADLNYESSCMTLNDEHIVQNEEGYPEISIIEPGGFDSPDGLRVSFINASKEYTEDSVLIGTESGTIKSITLDGCTSRQQASDIGVYILERLQLDRIISGIFRDDAVQLEPNDIITFNSTALAISAQLMRVQRADIREDGLIELEMLYESTELYDDDYDTDIETEYVCDLPDPSDPPPSVVNATISEESYTYRLRTFTRLAVTFDEPSNYPWFDYVEVWVGRDSESESDGSPVYSHQMNATSDFTIENVEDGEGYWVRLKVVSIHGTKQSDAASTLLYHEVGGYNDQPTSLDGLQVSVNDNTVNIWANRIDEEDIELYEFRLGATWASAIFLAALRAPNLSLTGVKPGAHTFWCNTLSTNGEYGATPVSASVTLIDPPDGWALQDSETCDYDDSGEDHQNTEQYDYSGDDYLKCSHGSAGLSGTYTSPIYDLGGSGRYLVYVLASIVMLGAGNTWDDVIPNDSVDQTTWDDINITTRTWREIFELQDAGRVEIRLYHGESSPPTSYVDRMEILSTIVTGRYFQVEITITDPSASVNAIVENFTLKFCQ